MYLKLIYLWRAALAMLLLAFSSGIGSYLADCFNDPTLPIEATFAFMLIVILVAGTITVLSLLFNRVSVKYRKRNINPDVSGEQ